MIKWTFNKFNENQISFEELTDVIERLNVIKNDKSLDQSDIDFWLEKLENDKIYYIKSIYFKIMQMPVPVRLAYSLRFSYGVTSDTN